MTQKNGEKKRQKRTKKGKIFKNFIKSVQNVKIF